MQELMFLSNERTTKGFKIGNFLSNPLTNKCFSSGVKSRYKNRIGIKRRKIAYISWSSSFFISHSTNKNKSVLNLDIKSSIQEKSLGLKEIN
jgi:hypothetical protein